MNTNPPPRAVVFFIVLFAFLLTGCPPQPPCDEKIDDPEFYTNQILANPVIQDLLEELKLRKIDVSDCIVDGNASITIQVVLPKSFSAFDLSYWDYISLAYTNNGTMKVFLRGDDNGTLDKDHILNYFKQKINMLESDPRVREVIEKTQPDPYNEANPLANGEVLRQNNRIQYNFEMNEPWNYLLSNAIEWQEFPEIARAHGIIKEHLLTGENAGCEIGRGEMHSYTTAQFSDYSTGPTYLTVAIVCDGKWKDAAVQLNSNGSYERLDIVTEY